MLTGTPVHAGFKEKCTGSEKRLTRIEIISTTYCDEISAKLFNKNRNNVSAPKDWVDKYEKLSPVARSKLK